MAEYRKATHEDCKPGALLAHGSALFDVLDRQGTVVIMHREGDPPETVNRTTSPSSYLLIREAPPREDVEELPVLDKRTDDLRRKGVLANLESETA